MVGERKKAGKKNDARVGGVVNAVSRGKKKI